jgi:hypothetical protein
MPVGPVDKRKSIALRRKKAHRKWRHLNAPVHEAALRVEAAALANATLGNLLDDLNVMKG